MSENLPAQNQPFMDKIKDKIKNSFVELVPDEQWEEMVQQEINHFFHKPVELEIKETGSYYDKKNKTVFKDEDGNNVSTIFRTLVWEMCIEETHKHIRSEYIQKMVYDKLMNNNKEMEEGVDKIIEEAVPRAITKFFTNMLINMKFEMTQDIMNMGNRQY